MRRSTTPDYILTIPGHDLRMSAVFVTLGQGENRITLTGDRLDITYDDEGGCCTAIAFRLTQEETLGLRPGQAEIQVRWLEADGTALCTEIGVVGVAPVLLEEVIAREDDGTEADPTEG